MTQFKIAHTFSRTTDENGRREYIIKVDNKTIQNGVEGQKSEWIAFNTAFAIHPKAAMLSTSIGLPQIMAFHYAILGYNSVGEMWDDFKKGEYQQVKGLTNFIKNNNRLYISLKNKDWKMCAYIYNGAGYKINNYDVKLEKAFNKFNNV